MGLQKSHISDDDDHISNSKSAIRPDHDREVDRQDSQSNEVSDQSGDIQEFEKVVQAENNQGGDCASTETESQSVDNSKDDTNVLRASEGSTSSDNFSLALDSE